MRKLFFWGFGIIAMGAVAIGGFAIQAADKLHSTMEQNNKLNNDSLTELKGDMKLVKYRLGVADKGPHP